MCAAPASGTWRKVRLPDSLATAHILRVSNSSLSTLRTSTRDSGRTGRLADVRCRAGRHDCPFAEQHDAWTVAVVRRGTFNYRAADTNAKYALRPGWLLLGRLEQTYECSHEHDGGDDCLALDVAPGGRRAGGTSDPRMPRSSFSDPRSGSGHADCLVDESPGGRCRRLRRGRLRHHRDRARPRPRDSTSSRGRSRHASRTDWRGSGADRAVWRRGRRGRRAGEARGPGRGSRVEPVPLPPRLSPSHGHDASPVRHRRPPSPRNAAPGGHVALHHGDRVRGWLRGSRQLRENVFHRTVGCSPRDFRRRGGDHG